MLLLFLLGAQNPGDDLDARIDRAIAAMTEKLSREYNITPDVWDYFRKLIHMLSETEPRLVDQFLQAPGKAIPFLKETIHRQDEFLDLIRRIVGQFRGLVDYNSFPVIADDPNPEQTMERLAAFLRNHPLPAINADVWRLFGDKDFNRPFSNQEIIQFMADVLDKGFKFFDADDMNAFFTALVGTEFSLIRYRQILERFEGVPLKRFGSLIRGIYLALIQDNLEIYIRLARTLLLQDSNLNMQFLPWILKDLRDKYPGDESRQLRGDILRHGTPWIMDMLKKYVVSSAEIKQLLNMIEEDMATGGPRRIERSMHDVYSPYGVGGKPIGFLGAVIKKRQVDVLLQEKEALERRLREEVLEELIAKEVKRRLNAINGELAQLCVLVPAGTMPQCGPICAGGQCASADITRDEALRPAEEGYEAAGAPPPPPPGSSTIAAPEGEEAESPTPESGGGHILGGNPPPQTEEELRARRLGGFPDQGS